MDQARRSAAVLVGGANQDYGSHADGPPAKSARHDCLGG